MSSNIRWRDGLGLSSRAWSAGIDIPPPLHDNWLHSLGTAIIFFFPTWAFLVVCLRIWCRWTTRKLGMDDAFIIAAMTLSMGWTGTLFMYHKTRYMGIHAWDIPPHDAQPGLVYDWLIQVLYNPVLALVKSSVLLFHMRLSGTKREVWWSALILNVINLTAMVAIFFTTVFQCVPVSSYWDESIPGRCIDNMTFNFFYNGLVIATDVAVLAIPFWVFLRLRIPRRLKIALLAVFFLGFIVTAVSCVRLYFLVEFFNVRYRGAENNDPSYTLGWTTSTIEGNLAIVAASVPSLWPVLRRIFPAIFSRFEEPLPEGYRGTTESDGKYVEGIRRGATRTAPADIYDSNKSIFAMEPVRGLVHTEIRSHSPSESQEEMVTYTGIMRTTNVDVAYDDGPMVPELAYQTSVSGRRHPQSRRESELFSSRQNSMHRGLGQS